MTPRPRGGEQCTAKSKRSGVRCENRVVGGGVCRMHGGASPNAKAARMQRIALSEALANDDRRHPAEVLADVGHSADFLMRQERESVKAGEPTPQLLEITEQAGRWAKIALDAEVDQRQTRVAEVQALALAGVIRRVLNRLDLTAAQQVLIATVVPEELERLAIEGGGE